MVKHWNHIGVWRAVALKVLGRYRFFFPLQLNGTAVFVINMTQIIDKLHMYSKIFIRATVMDHATFLTMTTEKQVNILSSKQLSVTIRKVDPYKNYFLLGYTYQTKVRRKQLLQENKRHVGDLSINVQKVCLEQKMSF